MLTIEMQEKIAQLKEKRNAVILAHNYQDDDVQEIADYCGDSFELSRMAAGLDAAVIVLRGSLHGGKRGHSSSR